MNRLKVFENSEFGEIRTVEVNGKPYFVASNVAKALGYSNQRDAIARHCKGVVKRDTHTSGGAQSMSYIPERDLYRLITHSKLESAERFESWVFDEVLPSIRRHGVYAVDELLNDPDMTIKAFTALKEEREKNRQLQADNNRMKPKEIFADAVAASQTSILIGELAKFICQNGYQIGQNRLFEYLRQNGYLMQVGSSRNLPQQRYVEQGVFEIKESNVQNPDGSVRITRTPKSLHISNNISRKLLAVTPPRLSYTAPQRGLERKIMNSREKGIRGELELAHKLEEYGYGCRRGQ